MASGDRGENLPELTIPHPALVPRDVCPNCQTPQYGEWCYHCGQRQRSAHREFIVLFTEAFDDVFSLDSRTTRTLVSLLFRPGYLTREYFAGRRARYIPPLKLYLVASVIFFFVLSLEGMMSDKPVVLITPQDQVFLPPGAQHPPPPPAGDARSPSDEDWRTTLPEQVDQLSLGFLSPTANQVVKSRVKAQLKKAIRMIQEDPQALINALLDVAPPVMFILVPLFAIFIMIAYLGSGRYYAEHLVLAAHNQSFMFVILILAAASAGIGHWLPEVDKWISIALWSWTPVYLYLSLTRTYEQGYGVTLVKFLFLGMCYWLLFLAGIVLALLLGLMTL